MWLVFGIAQAALLLYFSQSRQIAAFYESINGCNSEIVSDRGLCGFSILKQDKTPQ